MEECRVSYLELVCSEAALKLEEDARKVGEVTSDAERAINLSIAISLKRIADKLELASKPPVAIVSKEDYEAWDKMFNKS